MKNSCSATYLDVTCTPFEKLELAQQGRVELDLHSDGNSGEIEHHSEISIEGLPLFHSEAHSGDGVPVTLTHTVQVMESDDIPSSEIWVLEIFLGLHNYSLLLFELGYEVGLRTVVGFREDWWPEHVRVIPSLLSRLSFWWYFLVLGTFGV